jgi:hypothetical protein
VPTELDRARIDAVVQAVADRLRGDWLLIGGGLVALWFDPRRVTEDVDLVGIEGTGADRLDLLGLAHDLGLPVEAVNSAADFFVHKIVGWRQLIEPFRQGSGARIFRPSPTLFLLLKLRRLSARDLDDCLSLLEHVTTDSLAIDVQQLLATLDELPSVEDLSLTNRRARLRTALSAFST